MEHYGTSCIRKRNNPTEILPKRWCCYVCVALCATFISIGRAESNGKKVTVVVDAVGSHSKKEAMLTLRKLETKGAKIVDTRKLAGTSHLRLVGTCTCESCQGAGRKASVIAGEED